MLGVCLLFVGIVLINNGLRSLPHRRESSVCDEYFHRRSLPVY